MSAEVFLLFLLWFVLVWWWLVFSLKNLGCCTGQGGMTPGQPAALLLHRSLSSSKRRAGTCPRVSLKAVSAPRQTQGTSHKAPMSGASWLGSIKPALAFLQEVGSEFGIQGNSSGFSAQGKQQTHGCASLRQKRPQCTSQG